MKKKKLNERLLLAARNGREPACRGYLDRGADIEARDSAGRTPLMSAAWWGHDSVCELLLDRGADVEARISAGWTPLMYAAWNGHKSVSRLLLDRGADIEAQDTKRRTAIDLAMEAQQATVAALIRTERLRRVADEHTSHTSSAAPLTALGL